MEETGVELQQLLDEVCLSLYVEFPVVLCVTLVGLPLLSSFERSLTTLPCFIIAFLALVQEKLASVPLLIMANKQDLLNAMSPDEVSIVIHDCWSGTRFARK